MQKNQTGKKRMIEENFDLEMNYWTNENGQRLRWREWRHDNPRAIVFFSHSYGLHAGLIHNIGMFYNFLIDT